MLILTVSKAPPPVLHVLILTISKAPPPVLHVLILTISRTLTCNVPSVFAMGMIPSLELGIHEVDNALITDYPPGSNMVTLYSGDDVGWPNGMTLHHDDRLELEVSVSYLSRIHCTISLFCLDSFFLLMFITTPRFQGSLLGGRKSGQTDSVRFENKYEISTS